MMAKNIIVVFSGLLALVLGFAYAQPDNYRIEESVVILADAGQVFSKISDLKKWPAWSPWAKRDPNMKTEYSGVTNIVGAFSKWESKTEGSGTQTIKAMELNKSLNLELKFVAPFEGEAKADFKLSPIEDNKIKLTWGMDGNNKGFTAKFFYMLMGVEKMIAKDFKDGLQAIKKQLEG